MGLRQHFRFASSSPEAMLDLLRTLTDVAELDEGRGPSFVVFTQSNGPVFSFDCELVDGGIDSERAGEYFPFLGMFVEALTGAFGVVTVQDA